MDIKTYPVSLYISTLIDKEFSTYRTHSLHIPQNCVLQDQPRAIHELRHALFLLHYTDPPMQINMSFDVEKERSSEEVLYPLVEFYPHFVALQLQADRQCFNRSDVGSGYHYVNYWTGAFPTRSTSEEGSRTSRRSNSKLSMGQFSLKEAESNSSELESRRDCLMAKVQKFLCHNQRQRTNLN